MANKKPKGFLTTVLIIIVVAQFLYIYYQKIDDRLRYVDSGLGLICQQFSKIELWMEIEVREQEETNYKLAQLSLDVNKNELGRGGE